MLIIAGDMRRKRNYCWVSNQMAVALSVLSLFLSFTLGEKAAMGLLWFAIGFIALGLFEFLGSLTVIFSSLAVVLGSLFLSSRVLPENSTFAVGLIAVLASLNVARPRLNLFGYACLLGLASILAFHSWGGGPVIEPIFSFVFSATLLLLPAFLGGIYRSLQPKGEDERELS